MWAYEVAKSCVKTVSNYGITNMNNLYNFFLITIENMPDDEQRIKFIKDMKINLGMNIYGQFKAYIFKKIPDSDTLKLLV